MEASVQLEQAIVALLRGQNVAAANAFIMDISGQEAGWAAAMHCLQRSGDDAVRYFAANMLYTLARKQWTRLAAPQQHEVYAFLAQLVVEVGSTDPTTDARKQFLGRCILAFCCVCARVPDGGIKHFIDSALSLIDLQTYPTVSPRTMLGLEMLVVAPTELEEGATDDETTRSAVQAQLLSALGAVLQVVDAVAATLMRPPQERPQPPSLTDRRLRDSVLRLVQAWLPHGVTLSKAFEEHPHLVTLLWTTVQHGTADDPVGVVHALNVLKLLADVDEFPRPGSRTGAVVAVAQMLQSTAPLVAADNDNDGSGSGGAIAHAVCDCAVSLVSKETAVLAGQPQVDFFKFLLVVCAKNRKLATLGFEAWICLQDLPHAERHPFLQREVFGHVLGTVFGLCAYPSGFVSWDALDGTDGVDEDDFLNFRDDKQGLQDLLLCCFSALQGAWFDLVSQQLLQAGLLTPSGAWDPNPATLARAWPVLEAVLFVIAASMEEVKEYLAAQAEPSSPAHQLLLQITRAVLGIGVEQANLPLLETVTKYLGSTTFLLVGPWKELYFSAVGFLFRVLLATSANAQEQLSTIERYAAKSMHQLVVRGSRLFDQQQHVVDLVDRCKKVVAVYCEGRAVAVAVPGGDGHDHANLLTVVECVARTVPPALASTLACSLADTRLLASVLSAPGGPTAAAEAKAAFLLGCVTQVVRFSDCTHLAPLLHELWPLLTAVHHHPRLGTSPAVMGRLFSTLRSVLSNAQELATAQLPAVVDVITTYLERHLSVPPPPPQQQQEQQQQQHQQQQQQQQQQPSASVAAFECAAVAVEVLGSTAAPCAAQLAHSLLDRVAAALRLDTVDADAAESYFSFIYNCILFFPAAISKCSSLVAIVRHQTQCLVCFTERGPIRAALQVTQSFFSPASPNVVPYQLDLLAAGCTQGHDLVTLLFRSVMGGLQSSLWGNVAETLYCIVQGCEGTPYSADCAQWVRSALDQDSEFARRVPAPMREVVLTALCSYNDDKLKFKGLVQDIGRISATEVGIAVLLSHQQ